MIARALRNPRRRFILVPLLLLSLMVSCSVLLSGDSASAKPPPPFSPKAGPSNTNPPSGPGARNLQQALARPFRTGRLPGSPNGKNNPDTFGGQCGPMDVAFVIDDTGSMGGALDNVIADMPEVLDAIEDASGGDYRLSLVTFKDNVTVRVTFSHNNRAAFESQVRTLFANGGNDDPEASDEALRTVLNHIPSGPPRPQTGDFDPPFRDNAVKIAVLVTDMLPGGFDDTFTPGIDDVNAYTRAYEAAYRGVRISSVFVPDYGGFGPELGIMQNYARTTGGAFIETSDDGRGSGPALVDAMSTCGIGNSSAGCPVGSGVTNMPTQAGDDVFTMQINSSNSITTELGIGRFYGPLASDGHIDPSAVGVSVDNYAQLMIEGANLNQAVQVTFAGQAFTLPASTGRIWLLAPVDARSLFLPARGSTTSPPILAENCLIIRHNPGSTGTIKRVDLILNGMRPLAMVGGFKAFGSGGIENSAGSYGGEDGQWASSYPYNWFHYFLDRDGTQSIEWNGDLIAPQIDGVKRMYGVPKINMVGFSMGGLFSREYSSEHVNSLDNLVMIGTPNGGASLADAATIANTVCKFSFVDRRLAAACALFKREYDERKDALEDLTHDSMAKYNSTHPAVPCVNYTDQAGKERVAVKVCLPIIGCHYIINHTFNGDGVVGVPSVQTLPYSRHLSPVTIDMDFAFDVDALIVHGKIPKDPRVKDALDPVLSMRNNRYGCAAGAGGGFAPAKSASSPTSGSNPPVLLPPVLSTVDSGQTHTETLKIDDADRATFMLGWADNPTVTLQFTLTDPAGQVITPTSAYPGSTYGENYDGVFSGVMYEILNPMPGDWQANIYAPTMPPTPPDGEAFTLMGELDGGVQLNPQLSSPATPLGQSVMLTSTLTDGAAIAGAVVTATVNFADGTDAPTVLTLTEQTGGIYTTSYTPLQEGTYFISVFAQGTNNSGRPFHRASTVTLQASSAAALTGGYAEQPVPGGSSTYSSLVISATAVITEPGRYKLSGRLATSGGNLLASATGAYTLTAGTSQLPLEFAGSDIGAGVADGPYQLTDLYFSHVLTDELLLAAVPVAYTTAAYSRYDWPRGEVALGGTPTDQGVDPGNDGSYDFLDVTLPLDAKTAGLYSGTVSLLAPDGYLLDTASISNVSLNQGLNNVTVRFDGGRIRAGSSDGPYGVANFVISGETQPSDRIPQVFYRTYPYHSTDFALSGAYPTATRTATPSATSTGIVPPTDTPLVTDTPTQYPTCGPGADYAIEPSTGATVVPGTVDTGNHCDDCVTSINLPFPARLYGIPFNTAYASSNGNLQFASSNDDYGSVCLPAPGFNHAIFASWDDLRTDGTGTGIFTSVSGSAPNRVLNIEWRACPYSSVSCGNSVNFEIRLFENQDNFEIVYGDMLNNGQSATVGVQRGVGLSASQYSCYNPILNAGLRLLFRPYACGELTATVTATPTISDTPTATETPFGTSTPTFSPTNTITATPYPTCGTGSEYVFFQSTGGSPGSGSLDTGNHCDDCVTSLNLPFTYNLYGVPFTSANAASNGTLQFSSADTSYSNNCLPSASQSYTIFPYWDDLRTDGGLRGIFTSVSGSAPNRVFNIEWRACLYRGSCTDIDTNFEVRLYEGQDRFDIVYGTIAENGVSATVGVQRGNGISFTEFSCNVASISAGLVLTGRPYNCGEPTLSPTPTNTGTATPTPSFTSTNTFTPSQTRTPTFTVTGTPPTLSPTRTLTSTRTPTVTLTGTPPTLTPTRTPTNTPTDTGTPTPTPPCAPGADYIVDSSVGATVEPGVSLIPGSQCDECTVTLALPFAADLYGSSFNSAILGSNGVLGFQANNNGYYNFYCLPEYGVNYGIFAYWDDVDTSASISSTLGTLGVYTSVTGASPNRTFNIEWRACRYAGSTGGDCDTPIDFEIRLFEGQNDFQVVYGLVSASGQSATVGVQRAASAPAQFTQYFCDIPALQNGQRLTFRHYSCAEPTYTPSATGTSTDTPIPTITPGGPTLTPTATKTATRTATPAVACGSASDYVATTATAVALVPGTVDIGNHCDDCITTLTLPFSVKLYGVEQTVANISSNGNVQFGSASTGYANTCLPAGGLVSAILPYWTDLRTDGAGGAAGIFTSISGSAPSRIFNIEWRACHRPGGYYTCSAIDSSFEVRLYEGQDRIDLVYNSAYLNGAVGTTGVQMGPVGAALSSQFSCDTGSLQPGLQITYQPQTCPGAATDTPTITSTPLSTATPTNTPPPGGVLVGHVTWQGISQPNARNVGITATLTLCVGGVPAVYNVATDASGFFTATTGLASGPYNWHLKGAFSLSNSGTLSLSGGTTSVEMGIMRAGDSNNSNNVSVSDFGILRLSFGKAAGDPGYDARGDFNRDNVVNTVDFNLLKGNFGQSGAPANCP